MILDKSYTVIEAGDGPGALRLLEQEHPAVMLLDISMPGMDGIEVLQKMPPSESKMVVIVLTGEKDIEIAQKALTMGVTEFITKPFDTHYLRTEIRRLVRSGDAKVKSEQPPWRMVE